MPFVPLSSPDPIDSIPSSLTSISPTPYRKNEPSSLFPLDYLQRSSPISIVVPTMSFQARMMEINKERTAKRKAAREAKERIMRETQSSESWNGNGSSTGYSSLGSSCPSSLSTSSSKGIYIEKGDELYSNPAVVPFPSQTNTSQNVERPVLRTSQNERTSPEHRPTYHQVQPGDELPHSPSTVPSNEVILPRSHAHQKILITPHPSTTTHTQDGTSARMVEDDDEEVKRLMNQAENMLKISDNLSKSDTRLRSLLEDQTIPDNPPERSKEMAVRSVILTDPDNQKRQKAIRFLEALFLGLVKDIERSTKLMNDLEIEGRSKGKRNGSGRRAKGKKRKAESDDSGEDEDAEEVSERSEHGKIGMEISLKNRTNGEDQVISYPEDPTLARQTALQRITQRCRVAELLYEAVLTGCLTTKRDIYYKDVQLFKSQSVVDKIVDDIVASAGLKRQDFNVCAASKGLVASASFRIHLKSGTELSLSSTNASLIPPIERIESIQAEGGIKWVLIVEKDAVFQTLLSLRLLDQPDLSGGVIITGKGYPDLATIQLSKCIAKTYPSAKFHALVDADPHGIDIMQVYTNGSRNTRYSHEHANLALGDRLQWMGVKASEWVELGVGYDQLLELSDKDVEKAMAMLKRRDLSKDCRRELQHMLHINRKAEIQILSTIRGEETLESIINTVSDGEGRKKIPGLLAYVTERLLRAQ